MSGLRLLLGGDVMLGRGVAAVLANEGPDHPFKALSALIKDADLFFVNLECVLSALSDGPSESAPESYQAEPGAARALSSAGVKLVNLANNHTMDRAGAGLSDTITTLRKLGIETVGAGADLDEASSINIVKFAGTHVGVLAVCDHQEDHAASIKRAGIHYLDLHDSDTRRHLVERVSIDSKRCDHLIVSLHWLSNWVPSVPGQYRELAQNLMAAGARVVWGHGPHHILGTEWGGQGVALYATGDVIDDYPVDPTYRNDRQVLYLLELGRDSVERVCAYPISLGVGRACLADAAARRWIETRLRAVCQPLGSMVAAGPDSEFEIRPGLTGVLRNELGRS